MQKMTKPEKQEVNDKLLAFIFWYCEDEGYEVYAEDIRIELIDSLGSYEGTFEEWLNDEVFARELSHTDQISTANDLYACLSLDLNMLGKVLQL